MSIVNPKKKWNGKEYLHVVTSSCLHPSSSSDYTERLFGHTYALQSKDLVTASHLQVLICILFPMGCLRIFTHQNTVHAPNLVNTPAILSQISPFSAKISQLPPKQPVKSQRPLQLWTSCCIYQRESSGCDLK